MTDAGHEPTAWAQLLTPSRYSEFEQLRQHLVKTFPHATGSIPPLPPKSIFSKFQTKFLEKRKAGLSYFLQYAPRCIYTPLGVSTHHF